MRQKALLAIAFAGGILNSNLPALCYSESTDSATVQIESLQMPPEERAYYLLNVARDYISGDRNAVETQIAFLTKTAADRRFGRWDGRLLAWTNQAALERRNARKDVRRKSKHQVDAPIDQENKAQADVALKAALSQLEHSTDEFSKLNLYLIASRLFQRLGNKYEMRKCDKLVNAVMESCDSEQKVKAAASILDSKAYGFIPLATLDGRLGDTPVRLGEVKSFPERDFLRGEKLKLRAVVMADMLPPTSDTRRRIHRDLALWYLHLGKNDKAQQQKEILFDLVGFRDDSVLYPTAVGCGKFVWWEKNPQPLAQLCGMG